MTELPKMITVKETMEDVDLIARVWREEIDMNQSITPELRAAIHAVVDEKVLDAKERLLRARTHEPDTPHAHATLRERMQVIDRAFEKAAKR